MNILIYIAIACLLALAARVSARTLPAQNIALILGSLAAWEWALESLWAGPNWHWRGWLFWPALIVLARAGGRRLLRRRRQNWNYGVWLLVVAGAIAALAQFALALPGATLVPAAKLPAIRYASTIFCLFWLSPFFISKLQSRMAELAQVD